MSEGSDRLAVRTLVGHRGPVVLLEDADAAGVSRSVIRRMVDRGELRRLAKSAFAPAWVFDSANPWEQFRLRSLGFALTVGEGTFLTGPSAAAVLGIPSLIPPPARPVAIRPGSAHTGHNLSAYGHVRHGYLPPRHRSHHEGVPTVSAAYCAVDLARHHGSRSGLIATDHVLHQGASPEVLTQLTADMVNYPGMAHARWAIEHADGRAESPLETLGRYAFLQAGLPAPLSNVWIPVANRWFRVDHLLPDSGVILEADGAVKYDNRLDASALVTSDRERERMLRSLSFGVVRFTWNTALNHPGVILHRVREAARLRGNMPAPTQWTLELPGSSTQEGRAHQRVDSGTDGIRVTR